MITGWTVGGGGNYWYTMCALPAPEADMGAARHSPGRKQGHTEARDVAEHVSRVSHDSDTARGEE